MKRAIVLLVVVAGCSGAGSLPLIGESDFCMEVLDHWAAREEACHVPHGPPNYAKCNDTAWIPPSDSAKAECLADVDARDCAVVATLPESCTRLFPP